MQVASAFNSVAKTTTKGINLVTGLCLLTILLLSFALVNWVAANWSSWSQYVRLVFVQSLFWVAILFALITYRRHKNLADLAIQFAALCTGALLALIGQIYQTGAEPWFMFALWAILIIPWLILIRSTFITVLWILLLNITIFLYASNHSILMLWLTDGNIYLFLLNAILLLLVLRLQAYLSDSHFILRKILVALACVFLYLFILQQQFESTNYGLLIAYVVAFLAMFVAYYWFTKKTPDLVIVSLVYISAIATLGLLVFQLSDDIWGILILAIIVLLASFFASLKLLNLWQSQNKTDQQIPWYFYFLRVLALVLVAILFLTWLLFGFDFDTKNELMVTALAIIAVGALVAKYLEIKISDSSQPNIIYEASLVLVFAGLSLFIVVWILEAADRTNAILIWQILGLGLVIYLLLSNFVIRILSASLVVAAILWLLNFNKYIFDGLPISFLPISTSYYLCLFLLTAFYLWSKHSTQKMLQPLAVALFIWVIVLAIAGDLANTVELWHWPLSAMLASLAISILPAILIISTTKFPKNRYLLSILWLLFGVSLSGAFTLLIGLSLLVFAYSKKILWWTVLAITLVLLGLPLYYFQTSTSLDFKATQFVFAAAVLIWIILLVKSRSKQTNQSGFKQYGLYVILGALFVGSTSTYLINKYENILRNGTSVNLKLAPVDPRSLMQGDYMQLNYALYDEINHWQNAQTSNDESYDELTTNNVYYLILTADDQNISHLNSVVNSYEKAQELLQKNKELTILKSYLINGSFDWGAKSWFFAEGDASKYEAAKYGVLCVANDGLALLGGLLDKDLKPIGKPASCKY